MNPSTYIDSPESIFYPGNEAVMDVELDYIIASRHPGGVWDITWQWADYPKEFAVAQRLWQGAFPVDNIRLLKAFGRVEGQ